MARRMLKTLYQSQEKTLVDKLKGFKINTGHFDDINEDSDSEPEKYYAAETLRNQKTK